MLDMQYRFVDKSNWPDGLWKQEPDKEQFTDKETGLPCLIVRHPCGGHLCGYVGVGKAHPWYQKDYNHPNVDVHGGLTYSEFCVGDNKDHGVCHKAEPGEEEPLWWFGFDCAHLGDVSPGWEHGMRDYGAWYKDWGYVKAECANLARQIKNALDFIKEAPSSFVKTTEDK